MLSHVWIFDGVESITGKQHLDDRIEQQTSDYSSKKKRNRHEINEIELYEASKEKKKHERKN